MPFSGKKDNSGLGPVIDNSTEPNEYKDLLVEKVKEWQRKGRAHRAAWQGFLVKNGAKYGNNFKHDPKLHDVPCLEQFVAEIESGTIAVQDTGELNDGGKGKWKGGGPSFFSTFGKGKDAPFSMDSSPFGSFNEPAAAPVQQPPPVQELFTVIDQGKLYSDFLDLAHALGLQATGWKSGFEDVRNGDIGSLIARTDVPVEAVALRLKRNGGVVCMATTGVKPYEDGDAPEGFDPTAPDPIPAGANKTPSLFGNSMGIKPLQPQMMAPFQLFGVPTMMPGVAPPTREQLRNQRIPPPGPSGFYDGGYQGPVVVDVSRLPPSKFHGLSGSLMSVDEFARKNNLDPKCLAFLASQPNEIKERVIEMGSVIKCKNPSATIMGRIKKFMMDTVAEMAPCPSCNGVGEKTYGAMGILPCVRCNGLGKVKAEELDQGGTAKFSSRKTGQTARSTGPSIPAAGNNRVWQLNTEEDTKVTSVWSGDQQQQQAKAFDDGDMWECQECGNVNQPGDAFCGGSAQMGCRAPRPLPNSDAGQQAWKRARTADFGQWGGDGSKRNDAGGELGTYYGTIKSFNDAKWYGFIECPEITNQGYQDVFLHGNDKGSFNQGDYVLFTCYLTGAGKPQAKNLMHVG